MKKITITMLILLTAMCVQAQFTSGNLVVTRVGNGSTTLATTSAKVSVLEFSPTNVSIATTATTPVTSFDLGSTTSGSRLTIGGTTQYEGQISLSVDGKYLSLIGYDQTTGVVNTGTNSCQAGSKVICRIPSTQIPQYSSSFPSSATGSAKVAVSTDGSSYWTSIDNLGYIQWNSTSAPTQVATTTDFSSTTPCNLVIADNQLYSVAAYKGMYSSATALPTASSVQNLMLGLSASLSSQGLVFLDWDGNTSTGYSSHGYDVMYCTNKNSGLEKYYYDNTRSQWLPINSQYQLRVDIVNGGSGYTAGTPPTVNIGTPWVAGATLVQNTFIVSPDYTKVFFVATGGVAGSTAPTATGANGAATLTLLGGNVTATAVMSADGTQVVDVIVYNGTKNAFNTYTSTTFADYHPLVTFVGGSGNGVTYTSSYGLYNASINYSAIKPSYNGTGYSNKSFGGICSLIGTLTTVNNVVTPVLYALSGDGKATNNTLIKITDASGGANLPMTAANMITVPIAESGSATYGFRGVAFAPTQAGITTAVDDLNDNDFSAYATQNGLIIKSAEKQSYRIVNTLGQVIAKGVITIDNQFIPLKSRGVVIVQMNKKATKLVIAD